jgi:dynein heavy chain
MYGSMQNGQVP